MRRHDAARRGAQEARERAEAAERLAARLAAALDALPLGIVILDGDGAEVARNAVARDLVDARHGDALVAHTLGEVLARPGSSRTVDLLGPPARSAVVSSTALAGRAGVVGVVEDVTERRHLESVRRDFIANVSHELRTPIGALAALAEALGDETEPAAVRRMAGRIVAEADRAAHIVEDLLDLSRIEAHGPARLAMLALVDVLDEAVGRVAGQADERRVTLKVEQSAPDLRLPGDRDQLVSAVTNLLENAVKYSDAETDVTLTTAVTGDTVDVVVRDHGIGIPATDLDRIFERFYRVDRARSRDTGGTGLGLAIVRHVALNHGGVVLVDSVEGLGSTFTLRLPRGRA